MQKTWWAMAALSMALIGPAAMAQTAKKQASAKKTTTTKKTEMTKPATATDKASYAIGADLAKNLKQQGIACNPEMILAGIKDAQQGDKLALTDTEIQEAFASLQQQVQEKSEQKNKAAMDVNMKEGQEFLAANAKKEGVKTTASGLQYSVIKEGSGPKPGPQDTVTTHYHGTLLNGTVFDSSVERGKPISFPVNGVIKGWQEALQLMTPGSKYKLFIPSELAYGERGAGASIGPNSTLIFEVELISIQPKK